MTLMAFLGKGQYNLLNFTLTLVFLHCKLQIFDFTVNVQGV